MSTIHPIYDTPETLSKILLTQKMRDARERFDKNESAAKKFFAGSIFFIVLLPVFLITAGVQDFDVYLLTCWIEGGIMASLSIFLHWSKNLISEEIRTLRVRQEMWKGD